MLDHEEWVDRDFNELDFKDTIECPYCNSKISIYDFEDEGVDITDDVIETHCLFCDEEIVIISSADRKFVAMKK
jgi:hypothetical protein